MTYRVRIDAVPSEDVLREIITAAQREGADEVVVETTHEAGDAWIRAGFVELARTLTGSVEALETHLGAAKARSYGAIHVQTDDLEAVLRAVRQFVPRLPGGSRGSAVLPPRDGWISVYDELCDREPEMLRRLAREISDRMGAFVLALGAEEARVVRYIAFERGRIVDEYLSVPEYYGPLPPGEVIALGANPRLMARMTGADPDRIRVAARTARTPDELAEAAELLAEIAAVFGVDRAAHGYAEAADEPDAIAVAR